MALKSQILPCMKFLNVLLIFMFTLSAQAQTCQFQDIEIPDLPINLNFDMSINSVNLLTTVGKKAGETIPADYSPLDLVDVDYNDVTPLYQNAGLILEPFKMRWAPYFYLKRMLQEARSQNINLYIHSSFRPFKTQCEVFVRKVKKEMLTQKVSLEEAIKRVNTRSALPGTSEHQLGTSVDLVTFLPKYETPDKPKYSGYAVEYEMDETPAFDWLQKNAHTYGYVLSYPKTGLADKSLPHPKTGYIYEPWHWRYLGVKQATQYKTCKNMLLNDFLRKLQKNDDFNCAK